MPQLRVVGEQPQSASERVDAQVAAEERRGLLNSLHAVAWTTARAR